MTGRQPLPCPFCGSAPEERKDACCGRWAVVCKGCATGGMLVQTAWAPTRDEAVGRWNRRADG